MATFTIDSNLSIVQLRVLMVLERMARMAAEEEADAEMFSEQLEVMLSQLASEDAFGTEKQTDPRGDGRNGQWSMLHVESVDDVSTHGIMAMTVNNKEETNFVVTLVSPKGRQVLECHNVHDVFVAIGGAPAGAAYTVTSPTGLPTHPFM